MIRAGGRDSWAPERQLRRGSERRERSMRGPGSVKEGRLRRSEGEGVQCLGVVETQWGTSRGDQ